MYVPRDSKDIQVLRSHGSGVFPYAVTVLAVCLDIELLKDKYEIHLHPSKSVEFADAWTRPARNSEKVSLTSSQRQTVMSIQNKRGDICALRL